MRRIAISDIHGCARTFQVLVEKRVRLTPEDELFLLGDYIDRGPDSKGVIDYILKLQEDGYQVHCLRGNHEAMALESRESRQMATTWMINGGADTLESFSVIRYQDIPEKYWRFWESLDYYHETEGFLLVHAGFNFVGGSPLEDRKAMIWVRDWEKNLDREWLGDRYIIHGHTPTHHREIEKKLLNLERDRVLNIDGGCVFNRGSGKGRLFALDITHRRLYFCENLDTDFYL